MSKQYIILGNGFTMDLLNHFDDEIKKNIDVKNLFKYGDRVVWPKTNMPEFLSYKHCPNLWTLGARPHLSNEKSSEIIEDIITCANVYHSAERVLSVNDLNIYIHAYTELTMYLKYLFIHYNSLVSDKELKSASQSLSLLKFLNKIYNNFDEIIIVTYNYDIFLERILLLNGIDFSIAGKSNKSTKIKIHKPHGSISFTYKVQVSHDFSIRPDHILGTNLNLNKFQTNYIDLENDFSIVNAIIPPAGDSSKYNFKWSKTIQENLTKDMLRSGKSDKVIVFGLSYWHVDRNELDEILTKLDPQVDIKLINPNPPSSFVAVLTSLFKNFTIHNDANILGGK